MNNNNNNNNKRSIAELGDIDHDDNDDALTKIRRLQEENGRLKQQVAELKQENKTLKNTVDGLDEESDDEDDEDSVCDGSTWSKKYFLLKHYKQENGDCKVPQAHKQLGIWCKDMKKHHKKGTLAQERVDKLNKLGMHWGKGFPEPPTWDDFFAKLKKHVDTFGNANIDVADADPAQRSELAKWVLEQRKQGKRLSKMKPSAMTPEQYKRLNELNFKWKNPKSRRRS